MAEITRDMAVEARRQLDGIASLKYTDIGTADEFHTTVGRVMHLVEPVRKELTKTKVVKTRNGN